MKLPSAEEVRAEPMANGVRPVRWDLVDPWLARLKRVGDLCRLSDALRISRVSLTVRRRELGLDPLPKGRSEVVELTDLEVQTLQKLERGMTKSEIAKERGVSPAAVGQMVDRANLKQAWKRCETCAGYGAVVCGSNGEKPCANNPKHHHVCLDCSGDGKIRVESHA